ncbi:hypothetical protein ES703_69955 [subsurface metagenome]
MMEAKDTVMSLEQALRYGGYRYACEAQAEISFKAGFDSRKTEIEELMDYAFKDGEWVGKKAGIKEMVEWGNVPCPHIKGWLRRDCDICREAKLKEWE